MKERQEFHSEVVVKPKKEFPKTPSMVARKANYGLGKNLVPIFPLVRDEQGDIEIAGTRYSRKRQHQ